MVVSVRDSNKFKVTSLREARYVSAYIRFQRRQDWVSMNLPERQAAAINECNRQIIQLLSNASGQQNATQLFDHMREDLLPDSRFDWIVSGGDRACFFVEQWLKKNVPCQPILKLDGMDFIYACFDYNWMIVAAINQGISDPSMKRVAATQQDKEATLENLRQQFESKPDLSWVEKMTEDQLRWAKNYLAKNSIETLDAFNSPLSFDVSADNASYETIKKYVFCTLDQSTASKEKLDLYLSKMKSAFASKKNRDKGRNLNYAVSSEAFEQLGEIADIRGISKAKVVDWLIREEYKRIGR